MQNDQFRCRPVNAASTLHHSHQPLQDNKPMNLIPNADTDMVLAQLCHTLQLGSQLADAPSGTVDRYLAKLKRLAFFHRSIVLGNVVVCLSYGIDGPRDSGQFIQAAVTTGCSEAAISWNSEGYRLAKGSKDFEHQAYDAAKLTA